ncbi:MAG: serine--tRNA ligase [Gammaproteobacteria bacterium]
MLDPKLVRQDVMAVASALARRGVTLDTSTFEALEQERKTLQVETEGLQNQRKALSKKIGQAKAKGDAADVWMTEVETVRATLMQHEERLKDLQKSLHDWLMGLPNIPHESVPMGKDENDNIEVRRVGEPTHFDFPVQDHVALAERLSGVDLDAAVMLSGSRFVVMKGVVARLHRALAQFMLQLHTEQHGYEEVSVPVLVQPEILEGTGQLPKFQEDLFQIAGDRSLYLIPTAEVPVTNLLRDRILPVEALPIKYVCHSLCFRSEAGSYGKDMRGLFRVHQFEKVEMVQIVRPEVSYEALEEMVGHAEKVLQLLELPYRVVTLCGGDLGFSAAKTYDLEVWLPSQNRYREISSCSNTEAFQARRMQVRYRNPAMKKPELLHTLNGSGLAVGRCLIAMLENHQQPDGRIWIPEALRPFLGGASFLMLEEEQ